MYPSAIDTDFVVVKGLDYHREGINFVFKNLAKVKPLLDLKEENCKTLAKGSLVFYDIELLGKMMSIDLEENLIFANFFLRGLSNMFSILKGDYTCFLKDHDLLETLVEKIKGYAELAASGLNSIEHLEQLIDIFQESGVSISE